MTRKKRPGSGVGAPPRPNKNSNIDAYSLSPVVSLALEKAKRLIKGLPAREKEIHAKVLRQLEGTGLPVPDYVQVLVHQAGDDESVKADCKRLARELNASVLICDADAKILAFAWPNENGQIAQLLEFNPEAKYTLDQFEEALGLKPPPDAMGP